MQTPTLLSHFCFNEILARFVEKKNKTKQNKTKQKKNKANQFAPFRLSTKKKNYPVRFV